MTSLWRGARNLGWNQRFFQVTKSPGMGEPDIARAEGLAQVEQDRDLPYPVPIVTFPIQVSMPFRASAQKGQRQRRRRVRACNYPGSGQQRLSHSRGLDIQHPQHARGIATEAMIPMNDMRQWIGCQRVGELGGGGDKPLER
jgi:hypothetical protein